MEWFGLEENWQDSEGINNLIIKKPSLLKDSEDWEVMKQVKTSTKLECSLHT